MATSLNNLGALQREQGRYAEAEPLFRRALAIHEKVLDPDHPTVAANLNNLVVVYLSEGRYGEAEPLFRSNLAAIQMSEMFERAMDSLSPPPGGTERASTNNG